MGCGFVFLSCHQLSNSVQETFKSNDTVLNKKIQGQRAAETDGVITETYTTTHTEQHTEGESINFLTDTEKLIRAENALKQLPQFAGKEIFIYLVAYFYDDGRINILLQSGNSGHVANYSYQNGIWSEPVPFPVPLINGHQQLSIPLSTLSFANVAGITRAYRKKVASIEGAVPLSQVYVSIFNNEIHWFPSVITGSSLK